MKTPKERDTLDLLQLVCELSVRNINFPSEEMHNAYWEARKELESRISENKIANPTTDFIDKEYDWIEEQISDIMIEDGPDGHSDGSGIIADFVMALIEGSEDKWIEEYEKKCKAKVKKRAEWRKQYE